MGSLTNSLFLLEFVVGEVSIPECPDHSVEYVFRFLGHIVGISEKDFPKHAPRIHKGGKSCIFGLSDEQAKKVADDFKVFFISCYKIQLLLYYGVHNIPIHFIIFTSLYN